MQCAVVAGFRWQLESGPPSPKNNEPSSLANILLSAELVAFTFQDWQNRLIVLGHMHSYKNEQFELL
jgi:hypothetical protein